VETSRGQAAGTVWLALEANATDFSGKQDFGMCESQICKMVLPRHAERAIQRPPYGRQLA
jgi:hypothetical protein